MCVPAARHVEALARERVAQRGGVVGSRWTRRGCSSSSSSAASAAAAAAGGSPVEAATGRAALTRWRAVSASQQA